MFFFSSRRRHTRYWRDWSSDVCSSDLRTKLAVRSTVPSVNAKGACIGPMGQRVRNVMHELHGEKIDIVDWSEDPAEFVGHALSPARVSSVEVVDAEARSARVVVPDYQDRKS